MIFSLTIFIVSLVGTALLFLHKARELAGYTLALSLSRKREQLDLLCVAVARAFSDCMVSIMKYINVATLRYFVSAVGGLSKILLIHMKEDLGHYFVSIINIIVGKKFIKKKGSVSFYLQNILEYKNGLSREE